MDVVIVGGSLCGLMYGIVLLDLGHKVRIFERSPEALLAQAGAGLQVSGDLETFMREYDCDSPGYFINNSKALVVDREGNLITTLEPGVRATSWDTLYYRLRVRFDGLKLQHCDRNVHDSKPRGTYLNGHQVTSIELQDKGPMIHYHDGIRNASCIADLLISADGAGSTIRAVLQPNVKPEYLEYVALRGTVRPENMTEIMRATTDRHCQIKQSFFISYTMPGAHGRLEIADRVRNWVWYMRFKVESEEFRNLMTDVEGKKHTFSLPKGSMREEIWHGQLNLARQVLDRECAEHLHRSETPFVQAITHLSTPRAVYADGRILLVGDAFATLRPLSGQGTNQAAKGALAMKSVLQGRLSWHEWEEACIKNAEAAHNFGLERERGAQLRG